MGEVRKALNVCGNAGEASFGSCGAGCIMFPKSFGANDTLDNVGMISKLLEMKIHVLMVYGMKDTTCNYEGAGWYCVPKRELVVLKYSPICVPKVQELVLGGHDSKTQYQTS